MWSTFLKTRRVTMFVRFEIAPQRSTPISPAPEMGEVSPALLLALKSERARIAQDSTFRLILFFPTLC